MIVNNLCYFYILLSVTFVSYFFIFFLFKLVIHTGQFVDIIHHFDVLVETVLKNMHSLSGLSVLTNGKRP